METSLAFGVPDFGTVIERDRLVSLFLGSRPALTLICAPTGYGKSVLASQLGSKGDFDRVLWIRTFDENAEGGDLVSSAAVALRAALDQNPQDETALASDSTNLLAGDFLAGVCLESVCVVLDGCGRVKDVASLDWLARSLRRATGSSCLIVTCRGLELDQGPEDTCSLWVVEEQDLRFVEEDVVRLQRRLLGDQSDLQSAQDVLSRFCGHPALTSLMLKHSQIDDETCPPRDLLWYADRLMGQVSDSTIRALYVATLLREDSVANLESCLQESLPQRVLDELRSLAPLLVFHQAARLDSASFRVHAVLRESTRRVGVRRLDDADAARLRSAALRHFDSLGAHARLAAALHSDCQEREVVEWLVSRGWQLLQHLGCGVVSQLLQCVSPALASSSAHLLQLRALILRELEQNADALIAARMAADLAETEGDHSTWSRSTLIMLRIGVDENDLDLAKCAEQRLRAERSHLDEYARRLLDIHSVLIDVMSGNARGLTAKLEAIGEVDDLDPNDLFKPVSVIAGVVGMWCGDWATTARLMSAVSKRQGGSPNHWLTNGANQAALCLELGALGEAKALLDRVIDECQCLGLRHLAAFAQGTRATVCCALGDDDGWRSDFESCVAEHTSLGDLDVLFLELLMGATSRRSRGHTQDAMALVEQAEMLRARGVRAYMSHEAVLDVEKAACLAAMGDVWSARRLASAARASLVGSGASGQLLRCDLILAELDRSEGNLQAAVGRVASHATYILTGSANWVTAMNILSFPGLLSVVAMAIGVEEVPLRLLSMLRQQTFDDAQVIQPGFPEGELAVLHGRCGSSLGERRLVGHTTTAPAPACYVRLFGGLEVKTKDGLVDDSQWRKRKARLVFAILVLKQHQDVPRDVLLEHLWPDMDDEHAKRNFYVTWSTMKRALACGGAPSAARQYVQCTGGVCRLTRDVRSDVDDFDDAIAALRSASSAGDTDATLAAAQTLVGLYRGELLPGDLYEEWFTDVRERTKHDFCDAMMCAATVAEDAGDSETALFLLRKAALADPWREDVYQSTMRCQMHAGQRSRAIETYLSCRSRLTEDLGIDPSIETTRIYQSVLAMEEADETPVQYATE